MKNLLLIVLILMITPTLVKAQFRTLIEPVQDPVAMPEAVVHSQETPNFPSNTLEESVTAADLVVPGPKTVIESFAYDDYKFPVGLVLVEFYVKEHGPYSETKSVLLRLQELGYKVVRQELYDDLLTALRVSKDIPCKLAQWFKIDEPCFVVAYDHKLVYKIHLQHATAIELVSKLRQALIHKEKTNKEKAWIAANNIQLYFFTASWCAPCKKMKSIIVELERDGCSVTTIDADANEDIMRRYNVKSVPTLIIFKGFLPHARLTGVTTRADILAKLYGQAIKRSSSKLHDGSRIPQTAEPAVPTVRYTHPSSCYTPTQPYRGHQSQFQHAPTQRYQSYEGYPSQYQPQFRRSGFQGNSSTPSGVFGGGCGPAG